MKALLSASTSLSSRRLLNQSAARRKCVTTAAGCSGVCAAHENGSQRSKNINIDASHKLHSPLCRKLMGTAARGQQENNKDDHIDFDVQVANERCSGNLHIKKVNPDQWGVFTHRPHTKGSIVISSNLTNTRPPNPKVTSCSHSIQIDFSKHILMELPAQFLNHSCDPNIGVAKELNKGQSYDFVALRDIEEGDQLRFDYETTEYEVGAFEDCKCGADICRGTIKGYKYNKNVILEKYGGKNIAGYLME